MGQMMLVLEYLLLKTATNYCLKAGIHGATSSRFVAQMNMDKCSANISKQNNYGTFTHIHMSCMRQVGRKSPRVGQPLWPRLSSYPDPSVCNDYHRYIHLGLGTRLDQDMRPRMKGCHYRGPL